MYIQCKTGYILTVTQKYIYIWTGGDYMHVLVTRVIVYLKMQCLTHTIEYCILSKEDAPNVTSSQ